MYMRSTMELDSSLRDMSIQAHDFLVMIFTYKLYYYNTCYLSIFGNSPRASVFNSRVQPRGWVFENKIPAEAHG